MGLDGWLVKVYLVGKRVFVLWWVELDVFSLECNEVVNLEVSMGLVWLLAAHLLMFRVVFLFF